MLRLDIDDNLLSVCGDFNSHVGINLNILKLDDGVRKTAGLISDFYKKLQYQPKTAKLKYSTKKGKQR